MDLQAFGFGQSTIQPALNQTIFYTLHQTSQIGGLSESAAVSAKGRNVMEHSSDFRLDVAELNAVQFFKFVFGLPGGVWLCIVLRHQNALLVDQSLVLLFQLFVDSPQLLTVNFGTDGTTIRNQLKMHDSIEDPPNAQHDFLAESILFWNR